MSFDPTLIVSTLSAKAITVLSDSLAPLAVFSTDFSEDVVEAQGVINVPVAVSGNTTLIDPDNFEPTDNSSVVNAKVAMKHYSQPFKITSKQLNSGNRLETLAQINLDALAQTLQTEVFKKITTASFGDSAVVGDGTFDVEALHSTWGELKGRNKNIVMDSTLFQKFLPKDANSLTGVSRYGFKNFVMTDDMAGAPANTSGFVCAPSAMAIATAIPENPASEDMISSTLIFLEDLGITVQLNIWASTNGRSLNASYDVAMGAIKADGSALKIIKSA